MVQGMGTPRKQRELNVKADEVVAVASLWRGIARRDLGIAMDQCPPVTV
jgi:hypothetical protein